MSEKFSLVVFAPHPDDLELTCGGLVIKMAESGYRVTVIELTRGELGSQGTVEERDEEIKNSSKILGISHRECLNFPDGGIANSTYGTFAEQHLKKTVSTIRRLQPEIVLCPFWQERHPDHIATTELIEKAVFCANLKKFSTGLDEHAPHLCEQVLYYPMRFLAAPSFVVDTSKQWDKKLAAIKCFGTQINRQSKGHNTLVNSPLLLEAVEAKDKLYGAMIGVRYGEGFVTKNVVPIADPIKHFREHSTKEALFCPPF